MIDHVQALILAAGRSTRFATGRTKLLEPLCGQPLIMYPVSLLASLNVPTTLVVGHEREQLQQVIAQHGGKVSYIIQTEQRGTGHAVLCTKDTWKKDHILVMNGDMPLVQPGIIEQLYHEHISSHAAMSMVIAHNADPTLPGYGRVIKKGGLVKIIEANEFTGDTHDACCVNAGVYLIRTDFLRQSIADIQANQTTGEFYLPELTGIAGEKKLPVTLVNAPFDRIRGVNTVQEFWTAQHIKRSELISYWMNKGVTFDTAQNVQIDLHVGIGVGTRIGGGVQLLGKTTIGAHSTIGALSQLVNATVGDNVTIDTHTIVRTSTIRDGAHVGPFAHIRENSTIGQNAVIGNFVEIKKSSIGDNTKAKHLSYLGDATIGDTVNIGAGTITCNHDGVKKHQTTIENNAYIGANNSLVAPVTVGAHAVTGAGSVITDDVPDQALAIARCRQTTKPGWVEKKKQQSQHKDQPKKSPDQPDGVRFIGAVKTDNDSSYG